MRSCVNNIYSKPWCRSSMILSKEPTQFKILFFYDLAIPSDKSKKKYLFIYILYIYVYSIYAKL